MQRHIVILGGGYAGLTAAQRLGKQRTGAAITLIDAKPEFEERIRLHQVAAGQAIQSFPYREFLDSLGVTFLQARIEALDPAGARVNVRCTNGTVSSIPYDFLVYALGSSMKVDAVPGAREHAYTFDSAAVASKVYAELSSSAKAQVLVVGGGLTGIETAAELAESLPHLCVTLVSDKPFCEDEVPSGFTKKATQYLYQALKQRKVTLRTGARVTRVKAGSVAMSDGKDIAFDACLWTSGFTPSPLARTAGIQVNQRGQILTDAFLRSLSHPNIIAIGDAAQASSGDAGDCRMGSATALAMATAGARTLTALLRGKAPPVFRFVYLFRNICLGRRDGIVQFVDRRDIPRGIVWTGAAAAAWKEYICQSTLSTIGLCAPEKPPALPPLRTLPQLIQGMKQYA